MKLKSVEFLRATWLDGAPRFTVHAENVKRLELLEGLHAVVVETHDGESHVAPWSGVVCAVPAQQIPETVVAECVIEPTVVDFEVLPAVTIGPDEMDALAEAQVDTVVARPAAKRNRSRR